MGPRYFEANFLILLRHRIGGAWVVLRDALQQGHRARVVARATIRCRRIVAIEFATCRSGRTGGASGGRFWEISGVANCSAASPAAEGGILARSAIRKA